MQYASTLLFLSLLGIVAAHADDGPDFSRYPQFNAGRNPDGTTDHLKALNEGGFAHFAHAHLEAKFSERIVGDRDTPPHSTESLLLALSFMSDNGGYADEFFVTKSGHLSHCNEVYDWATQGSGHRQLTEQQLAMVRQKISQLPKDNSYPALKEGLVIASFRDGEKWITRTYRAADVKTIRDYLQSSGPFH